MKKKERSYPIVLALTAFLLFLIIFSSTSSVANAQSASPKTYAYITNGIDDIVDVIDTVENSVKVKINVGIGPFGVAVNPTGTKVYVTNQKSNTVSIIDTTTNTVTATVNVGIFPTGIAVTPDGTKVYVANYESNTVSVIDTAVNRVIATVNVGSNPHGVAVNPTGTKVYVTTFEYSGTVDIIDTATNSVIGSVNVGSGPIGVAVTPDGTKVYVANSQSNNVSVVDTDTNSVTATIDVKGGPKGISFTPDGTKVYVTNFSYKGFGGNTVSVIDTATNTIKATVNVGDYPEGIAVTPDGKKVYVADNGVSVIDTATNTVTATIESIGSSAFGQFICSTSIPKVEPDLVETETNDPVEAETNNPVEAETINLVEAETNNPVEAETNNLESDILLYSLSNQYKFGESIALTAAVDVASQVTEKPSGTVTFMDGNDVIGTEILSSGRATLNTSSLSVGSHSITATYNSDNNFKSSQSSSFMLEIQEIPELSITVTNLSSSVNESKPRKPITFIAVVNATSQGTEKPSGKVTFMDGETPIGIADLISGQATFTTSFSSVGLHSITAEYSGNNDFKSSTSSGFTLTVKNSVVNYIVTIVSENQLVSGLTVGLILLIIQKIYFS